MVLVGKRGVAGPHPFLFLLYKNIDLCLRQFVQIQEFKYYFIPFVQIRNLCWPHCSCCCRHSVCLDRSHRFLLRLRLCRDPLEDVIESVNSLVVGRLYFKTYCGSFF